MKKRVVIAAIIVLFGLILNHVMDYWTVGNQNRVAVAQLNGGEEEFIQMRATNDLLMTIRILIFPAALLLSILCLSPWKYMKRKSINEVATVVLLFGMMFSTVGCGIVRPYKKPILENVENNETAFLIPLDEEQSGQARFASVDYLKNLQVAIKRVEIPQRWLQTGRSWLIFRNRGEWIPSAALIKVNRTPVARRWTAETDTGTLTGYQALEAESKDSIGVSSGFAITAFVREEDAATFLYWFPKSDLATIIDNQIFNAAQAVYARETAKYELHELREKKAELTEVIKSEVIPKFAALGITIDDTMGLIGGFVYDNPDIQSSIDVVFQAQTKERERMAAYAAQLKENERKLAEEENSAEVIRVRARAEADAIKLVADELRKAGEQYLIVRRIEALEKAISKWNGQQPTVLSGGDNTINHLLMQTSDISTKVADSNVK